MFQNRHMQVKFVKDNGATPEDIEVKTVDPAQIAEIVVEAATKTAIVIGGVVAANRVLKTICEVAVVVTKAKIK